MSFVDFKNKQQVLQFLKKNFNKKRYIYKSKLFWQLVIINNNYPEIILEIINNLEKLTCWKSYFVFLSVINNFKIKTKSNPEAVTFRQKLKTLERQIYNILMMQYKKDIQLLKTNTYAKFDSMDDIKYLGNSCSKISKDVKISKDSKNNEYISNILAEIPIVNDVQFM